MGLIRIQETGQVVTEISFRQMHKKTRPVLGNPLTLERLNELGADPVFEGPAATTTGPYEFSFRSGVEQNEDGQWFTVYSVGPVFNEYTDEDGVVHTVEAQTAAYRARIDEQTATGVRNTRNKLLADTDWIVIMHTEKGTNIPATVEIYRQALRDITDHANFPHLAEDDWPTKP
jgi:hypothetical protein